ncbi:MAG TPA: JAB domain-containing protein [Pelobium sp.]|nr:JAB domain-containing protein [Pelobium sp.]
MEQNVNSLLMVSEIELVYKPKIKPSERLKITSSKTAYEIFLDGWDKGSIEFYEQFKIMLLNKACKVLGVITISRGGIDGTFVDLKLVFGTAIKAGASNIILAHNHPSGNLRPSHPDINLTRKLVTAGKILEVQIIEHLIITSEGYYSFADEGLI